MKTIPIESDQWQVASDKAEDTAHSRRASRSTFHVSRLTRHRAFTIVELLVVIAIIGILAGMILPALSRARVAAQKTQARKEESDIIGAIQQYDSVYGRFPVSNEAQKQAAANAQKGENPDVTYGGVFKLPDGTTPIDIGTYLKPPFSGAPLLLTNAEVIGILMDLTNCPNGDPTANVGYQKNPQQTIFLNPKMVDTNTAWSGVGQDLMYRDPWGNPYVISMDLNYDEQCRDAFYCSNTISGPLGTNPGLNGLVSPDKTLPNNFQYHGKVMVWSAGPDGKIDVDKDGTQGSANSGVNKDNVISWQ